MARALAQVTCPSCKQPFSALAEQVLDVDLDPSAKPRLLSGQVNLMGCPHCGMTGAINMPFIYHDASQELALVFMPMEAGRDNLEQQQLIGALSRAVMNQVPPEQRKGYLLSPQVFFSYENLVNRVLEADGITPEMIQDQKAKADLLRRLLEAPTAEERTALAGENEEMVDEEFFRLLQLNLGQAEAMGQQELAQRILDVRTLLYEQTPVGRQLAARGETLQALQDEPTRDRLLELLVASEDPDTRAMLIAMGQPLLDYFFFQAITQRIEGTSDKAEREQLEALRQEVLTIREQMQEQAREVVESRAILLRELLATEQPELLARRHLDELDDLFFSILAVEIEQAQKEGNLDTASRLQEVWRLAMSLLQEQVPPELALLTQVLQANDEEEVQQVLESNRGLIGKPFVQLLEQVIEQMQEEEKAEVRDRVKGALAVAQTMVESQEQG